MRISNEPEERKKEEREKMPFIVATYVYASSHGQHMHSTQTKMPFIVATYVYASSQGQRTHSDWTNMLYVIYDIYICRYKDGAPNPYCWNTI